jgi:transcriptional regulator NrdR family protein
MNCPACGYNRHQVVGTRHVHGIVHRRRQCMIAECGRTFTTVECLAGSNARRTTGIKVQMHSALARLSRLLDKLGDGK